jgi:hypothetical protein
MYIGEKWISTDVDRNLSNKDFYSSKDYQRLLNICTDRVTRWVEHNGDLIGALNNTRCTSYGARQIAYADCGVGTYIGKIQQLGRHAYAAELRKQVAEALAEEYAKLPEFARQAYSLDNYVENFVSEHMKKNKNKINREISARAYNEMRRILDRALW